eukprot:TRINITY_DN20560_c0_g1_i2.p1 TRINITY_DN20560_c0_g1~~TRINITY_DN20560_c0_g1_i2.p1  ORF type:complete len:709 (-),score=86.69 TRINITY_DN20560_c0_g1_i2:140-2065(-)
MTSDFKSHLRWALGSGLDGTSDIHVATKEIMARRHATTIQQFLCVSVSIVTIRNLIGLWQQRLSGEEFEQFATWSFQGGRYIFYAGVFPILLVMLQFSQYASRTWVDIIHVFLLGLHAYRHTTVDAQILLMDAAILNVGRFSCTLLGTAFISFLLNLTFALASILHKHRLLYNGWQVENQDLYYFMMTDCAIVFFFHLFAKMFEMQMFVQVQATLEAQRCATGETTARSLLLGLCDVVLELFSEPGFPITSRCPQLEAFLLRGPLKCCPGHSFLKLVAASDRTRFIDSFSAQSDVLASLHISLLDCRHMPVRVQLFHVSFFDINNRRRHLVGIREECLDEERNVVDSLPNRCDVTMLCNTAIATSGSPSAMSEESAKLPARWPRKESIGGDGSIGEYGVSNNDGGEAFSASVCKDASSVRSSRRSISNSTSRSSSTQSGSSYVRRLRGDVSTLTDMAGNDMKATCWFEAKDPTMEILRCSPSFSIIGGTPIEGITLRYLTNGNVRFSNTVQEIANDAFNMKAQPRPVCFGWLRLRSPNTHVGNVFYLALCTLSISNSKGYVRDDVCDGHCEPGHLETMEVMADFSNVSICTRKPRNSIGESVSRRPLCAAPEAATMPLATSVGKNATGFCSGAKDNVPMCL